MRDVHARRNRHAGNCGSVARTMADVGEVRMPCREAHRLPWCCVLRDGEVPAAAGRVIELHLAEEACLSREGERPDAVHDGFSAVVGSIPGFGLEHQDGRADHHGADSENTPDGDRNHGVQRRA